MNFLLSKRKVLITVISIISFLIFSSYLFAYDEIIVHPSLTSEMAKLYNLNYSDKLTDQEIDWMKKGAKDEDERQGLLIRSGNHFYNPFGIKKWADNTLIGNSVPEPKLTAKEWAHNSLEQDSFPGGDFTWERAIWDYVNGDKQHAYESLGHVMHLIEDSTVPAHVRNDLHISPNDKDLEPYKNIPNFEEIKKSLQDGEPYEAWTGGEAWGQRLNYNFADDLFQANKKPLEFNSIDGYFDDIAKYTNTKFFSKDTIYSYTEPNNHIVKDSEETIAGKVEYYVYGFDENNKKIRLAKISDNKINNQEIYTLKELGSEIENNIYSDYWSHLAPRAVLTGAGIIKLFKDEASKAAENPQSVARPKSIASVYGPLAPAIRSINPSIRNISTSGQLLANASIYVLEQTIDAAKNSVISAYDNAKSSVYNLYNQGVALADSSAAFVSRYFNSTAKAELKFNISEPAAKSIYSIEDIIKQAQAISIAKAQTINDPVYGGSARVPDQNKNLSFSPGDEISLRAEIKNTGTADWQGEKISLNVYVNQDLADKFYHSSWLTKVRPASLGKAMIAPEKAGIFDFVVRAPLAAGDYYFRVRPVRQSDVNEFSWLGDDILSWRIRVEAPKVAIQEETNLPRENNEQAAEIGKTEEEILALENNLPINDSTLIIDDNIEKEKLEAEALAAAEAARLAEEEAARLAEADAARLKEEEELIMRRRRAWVSTPPETTITEFPEQITFETEASFKFSSSKGNYLFECSLDGAEFAPCEEIMNYENLTISEHILKVKAKDQFGNIDETPAEYAWKIEKEKSAGHLVISEVRPGTIENGRKDEFVELYNPTDETIILDGWELRKKNSEGNEENLVDNGAFDGEIAPKSFFLIAHENYRGSVDYDQQYSADNDLSYGDNSAVLYNGDHKTGAIIDEVSYLEIPEGGSLERKALKNNSCVSPQGKGEFLGNECDADSESDFELRLSPNPQNSKSIPEPALTPVHNITRGFDYPTIQWAIDSASAGDEIQVDSGKYFGKIQINKALILKGVDTGGGKPVLSEVSGEDNINLTADGITVEGFSITGFSGSNDGFYVKSNNNVIINNTIKTGGNGIYIYKASNNNFSDNSISGSNYGIYLYLSNNNVISDNTVANSKGEGIVLHISANNMVSGNIVDSNGSEGIELINADNNNIKGNVSRGNHYGILLQSSSKNIIIENIVNLSTDYGFLVYGFSSGNEIYHNSIINNKHQAHDGGIGNFWNSEYPSGGNFWSDYADTDINGGADQDVPGSDGIGDTPHIISDFNEKEMIADRYPLMKEYVAP